MTTAFLPLLDIDDDTSSRMGRPVGTTTERPGPRVKLFVSDEPTPCQSVDQDDIEMWFGNEIGGRDLAVMACQACPFRGRCSYNAVAVRATHGIWGGIELEERRQVEVGDVPVEPLAADEHFMRRRQPAA